MKKILILPVAVLVTACVVHADTWIDPDTGLAWTYSISGGTAEVGGVSSATGSISIPSALDGKPVTSIGYSAFYNRSSLTSVAIPNSVTNIGDYAFYNCRRLASVTIPDGVTSIGRYAFYGCSTLTSVAIPSSVTSIGSSAFYGCSGLTTVHVADLVAWCGILFGAYDANPLYYAHNLYLNGSLVTDLAIPDGVTSIGRYAFYGCSTLTSVAIPSSVTSIGSSAFYGCSGRTAVHVVDLVAWCGILFDGFSANPLYYAHNLYLNGSLVTDLAIPDGVTSIGRYAFYGCSTLTSVAIPSSVTSIGSSAFSGCSALTSVTIPSSVTSIGSSAFSGCSGRTAVHVVDLASWCNILFDSYDANPLYYAHNLYLNGSLVTDLAIPDGVTSIGRYAFCGCSTLTSVAIPSSVTSIGSSAFYGCSALTSVTIPNSVTSIGYEAFSGCNGLTAVHVVDLAAWCGILFGAYDANPLFYAHNLYLNGSLVTDLAIPDGVTSIGSSAFSGCSGLTSVTIPDGVTSIGSSAFSGCSGLTSVAIPDSVTNIGSSAFSGTPFYNDQTDGLVLFGMVLYAMKGTCPASVIIPNGVTSIGSSVFNGCSGLTSVTIPDSVTSIGSSAFYGCSGLTSVAIPNSVTSIGYQAFYGCSGLTSVTIPDSVTSIGQNAFYGCSNIRNATVPGWKSGIPFDNVTNLVISAGTTRIWYSAFSGCSGLMSVTIPNSVTNIEDCAFQGCSGLTAVHIADLAAWCGILFDDSYANPLFYAHNLYLNGSLVMDLAIPDGVTSIGDWAFCCCSGLASVAIPNSVTNIRNWAFYECSGLTAVHIADIAAWCEISFGGYNPLCYAHNLYLNGSLVTDLAIPDGVTSIGRYAFCGCSTLTSVAIPSSVTSIGSSAFYGCSGLASVMIPNSVTSIGYQAFSGCSGLTAITVADDNSYYSSTNGLLLSKDGEVLLRGVGGDVTIPDYVTSIEDWAFYGCSGLTSVTIPNSVTNVGPYAFSGCSNIRNATVPGQKFEIPFDNVTNLVISAGTTSIGYSAFSGCNGLMSVLIPDSVTSIGEAAFWGCRMLKLVYMPMELKGCFSTGAFGNCSSDLYIQYYNQFTRLVYEQLATRDGEDDSIEFAVTNACRVAFDWKCSCEPLRKGRMYDYLSFSVDGIQQDAICGEVDWTNNECFVEGDGEHILRWTYQKDESGSEGEDCGWIRLVTVAPRVTLSFRSGGAESGEQPAAMSFYADAGNVSLPGKGSLAWPKHMFLGWSDGEAVLEEGAYYPCSAEVLELTAAWVRKELAAPVINVPTEFYGEAATVMISAASGADIYYTLDDSAPTMASMLYTGAFTIDATTTVRAIATMDDYFDSPESAKTVTKNGATLGEAVNAPALEFTTDAESGWQCVKGESLDGYALRSGVIGHNATSRLETVVVGAGRIAFSCKVAGEVVKGDVYDGLAFLIDGVPQGELMGNTGWETNTFNVVGEGSHALSWLYVKDEGDEGVLPEDCAWIDEVVWTPAGGSTDVVVDVGGGKTVTVPGAWLSEKTEHAATDVAANGRKVWECYVVGLDPEDTTNDFRIVSFPMKADGTPDISAIAFDPPEAKWNIQGAMPVLKGKATLEGGEWQAVTDENKADMRFFKVEVALP